MTSRHLLLAATIVAALPSSSNAQGARPPGTPAAQIGAAPALPAANPEHKATKFSRVIGWPEGATPRAPEGFAVTRFASGLESPRWLLVLPNGDVLAAEATTNVKRGTLTDEKTAGQMRSGSAGTSADRITLLRDADGDGVAETRRTLLARLNQPFGMALVGDHLYVANTDAILRYAFKPGDETIASKPETVLSLPAGGYNNHWTRNLLVSRDGRKLLVSVGSGSNVAEHGLENEVRRANILEVDLDGSGERVLASGLRNPVGMAFEPTTGALWTAVNERDMLGDDLVPDYITSVRDGGFYGWPFSYWGQNADPRLTGQGGDLVAKAIAPDYGLGSHTASLGLAFSADTAFPPAWRGGAFVAQRGSWNRSALVGYKVVYVPFADGKPSGAARDFLTGFLADPASGDAFGRPVGVFPDGKGGLLVTDDAGNSVWRVAVKN